MSISPVSSSSAAVDFQAPCPSCARSEAAAGHTEEKASTSQGRASTSEPPKQQELTEEEKKQVAELKKRDREVKAHEAAHMAAGGAYVRGGASYSYQSGPDGKRYAVGGEVSIDTSSEDDPRATIRKMQTVRKAALAPANPSGQDRSVASAAAAQEAKARQELRAENQATSEEGKQSPEKPRITGSGNYSPTGSKTEASIPFSPEVDIAA